MNLESKLTHELVNMYYTASYRYYVLAEPTITDAQFDQLCRVLIERYSEIDPDDQALIPLHALQAGTGFQLVGQFPHWVADQLCVVPSELKLGVRHLVPMLSLENVFDDVELAQFMQRVTDGLGHRRVMAAEAKIDGMSLSIRYDAGHLSIMSTRGNGEVGENVTHNSVRIQQLPHVLPEGLSAEIRGEAYISRGDWDAYLIECERNRVHPMANPRNAVSGTIRRIANRGIRPKISFAAYQIVGWPAENHAEVITQLKAWGFHVPATVVYSDSVSTLMSRIRKFYDRRYELPYEIDGVVIKINSLSARTELGDGANAPRWAVSYKYPEQIVTAKVWSIAEQTGRTGRITPVALIEPVYVGGVMVSRASMHNFELIQSMGLTIGSTVELKRAGEVVPAIVQVIETPADAVPYVASTTCQHCGHAVEREGKYTHCPNRDACPAQRYAQLAYFCSRSGLDIDGIGPRLVELLMDREALTHYLQFFDDAMEGRLIRILGERMAKRIMPNIDRARNVELHRFLCAIGIPTVAAETARALANQFLTLDSFIEASVEELRAVPGIDTNAEKIHQWVEDNLIFAPGMSTRRYLHAHGLWVSDAVVVNLPLQGRVIAITGTFERFERRMLTLRLRQLGARVADSVTRNCDLLVVGHKARSKLQMAQTLGIATLTEVGDLTEQLQSIQDHFNDDHSRSTQ